MVVSASTAWDKSRSHSDLSIMGPIALLLLQPGAADVIPCSGAWTACLDLRVAAKGMYSVSIKINRLAGGSLYVGLQAPGSPLRRDPSGDVSGPSTLRSTTLRSTTCGPFTASAHVH